MDAEYRPIAFIGDEPTGLGLRLAGVECHHPASDEITQRFADLCRRARLILVTAEAAESIGASRVLHAQARQDPLIIVIPDARRRREPPDRVAAVRRQLGMSQ